MEDIIFSAGPNSNPFTAKPTPEKPPDERVKEVKKPVLSFRDKVMGNQEAIVERPRVDLLEKKLVRIDLENGNRLLPKVVVEESVFNVLCQPWKEALVIKLLGKTIGFNLMKDCVKRVWRLAGGFDLMDIGNGCFMVKLDLIEDKEKVIKGGPWLIFDHYLSVTIWSPNFVSPLARIEKTMVWVRFPDLSLVYYDEDFLMAMASAIGKPIKVDRHTLNVERGRFARVCVEIDLGLPVVGKICVNNYWYNVEYEGLHLICSYCGCYGHLGRNCKQIPMQEEGGLPKTTNQTPSAQENTDKASTSVPTPTVEISKVGKGKESIEVKPHGEWLVVQRKKKPTSAKKEPPGKQGRDQKANRFEGLRNLADYSGPKEHYAPELHLNHMTIQNSPYKGNDRKHEGLAKRRRQENNQHLVVPLKVNEANIKEHTSDRRKGPLAPIKSINFGHTSQGPIVIQQKISNEASPMWRAKPETMKNNLFLQKDGVHRENLKTSPMVKSNIHQAMEEPRPPDMTGNLRYSEDATVTSNMDIVHNEQQELMQPGDSP